MKKNSLKNKVWIYLTIFAIVILLGLWMFQILFLDVYYEWSKNRSMEDISSIISEIYNSGDYIEKLDSLAFNKNVCIEVIEYNRLTYSTDSLSRGCILNDSKNELIKKYKQKFINSNEKLIAYKIINPFYNNKTLVYGIKLKTNAYAFISTSLQPLGSTISILKSQLIHVTIIVLIIAFLIAYTISKKISKPIEKITASAKMIGKGNYNVSFNTNSDIEEIKALSKTLSNAALELSKTDELRRDLMANVSHDLKTPLTIIKANSEMVRDISYKNKEKRDKNLNTIIEEVDRLNLLVEDILDLSQMQANSISLNKEKFNLNEMVKSILNRFSVLCDIDKGYKIEFDGFDAYVYADKKRLEQVIYNLVNNALNYSGEEKIVLVKFKKIENKIRVEVINSGEGINDEELKYIWDRYYKVDKKYKRVTYGTGLGLSIVKNIFVLHNLVYGVESNKKDGTIFYFEIDMI